MRRVVETSKLLALSAVFGLSLSACSDDDGKEPGGEEPGPITEVPVDASSERRCPEIVGNEALTFREGFAQESNIKLFEGRYIYNKAYVADSVVNPGEEQIVSGRFFRAAQHLPGIGDGVATEKVYVYAEIDGEWTRVGEGQTNARGFFEVSLGDDKLAVGNHRLLTFLAANGTCIESGFFVWPENTPAITTDIDATLTISDDENLYQIFTDIEYVQKQNPHADEMMNAWYDNGYEVSYVTARPWDYQGISRIWLREQGFPFGPLELAPEFVHGDSAAAYKAVFVERLLALGIHFVAAYGNAESDVEGFTEGGISIDRVWSMGEALGYMGANEIYPGDPIEELGDYTADYSSHITDYVLEQPAATRTWDR